MSIQAWQLVVHGFRRDLPRLVSREKLAAMSALSPKADDQWANEAVEAIVRS
jgi:hypothetical protein